MMTPKDVQEHGFSKARKGYDMSEVDDFLDTLTADYTALYTNYGKLSNSYAKLRKKAQALAAALEQTQKGKAAQPAPAPTPAPVVNSKPAQPVPAVVSNEQVAEILNTARKDAQAIRMGAERERQEIINRATNYAAENVERLKAEVAAEEAHLATLKKATAAYISQVRQLISRQTAILDNSPLQEEEYTPVAAAPAAPVAEVPAAPVVAPAEEPTVRVDETETAVAEEISRSMLSLHFGDEDDSELDDGTSLFDAIARGNGGEFDEE